jgi:F-type H+-transporting ATPase subunit delta
MPQRHDEIAEVYARSLYELAHAAGGLDKVSEVHEELQQIVEMGRSNDNFHEFFGSPIIGKTSRQEAMKKIFDGRISDLVLRFLLVTNDKGRLGHLDHIAGALDSMIQDAHGRIEVDVFTVNGDGADSALLETVASRVKETTGKDAVLHQYADPSMIGGIKLLIGDKLYDGSVATRLRRLKEEVLGRGAAGVRAESARFLDNSNS